MKIAVIGNGIIGYVVSKYLSKKGFDVQCISPTLESAEAHLRDKKLKLKNQNQKINISPKLKREDVIRCKSTSDLYYSKETNDFFALELACEMGLSKYWGANLACAALDNDIRKLKLGKFEKEFLKSIIPILDVQEFYSKKSNKQKNIKEYFDRLSTKRFELKSSKLAIWENKCLVNNLPGFNFSKAIFGNSFDKKIDYKIIDGRVNKIHLDKKNKKLLKLEIKLSNNNHKTFHEKYDYVFVCCGAIGSYRLIRDSFNYKSIEKDIIKHHPLLATVCFIPSIPYPVNHFETANINLECKLKNDKVYINFIPLLGSLKEIIYQSLKRKKINFLKPTIVLILKFINRFSNIPLSPGWFLRRIYISNIVLSSKFTSSEIFYRSGKISIKGKFIKKFHEYVFNNIWPSLILELRKRKIYNLFFKPIIVAKGADLHYASTLFKKTDNDGSILINEDYIKNLKILDASSSEYLPTANPTYYFIARAIKLISKIK